MSMPTWFPIRAALLARQTDVFSFFHNKFLTPGLDPTARECLETVLLSAKCAPGAHWVLTFAFIDSATMKIAMR